MPPAPVTYDTYGHLFPERNAEITERLEGLVQLLQHCCTLIWSLLRPCVDCCGPAAKLSIPLRG